jgi:hypothetical protein
LLVELDQYGVDGAAWRLLREWYKGYTARVTLDKNEGRYTHPFKIATGTRQGSVLSPIFFAVAMNGLIRRLKQEGWDQGGEGYGIAAGEYKLPIVMQADDIVLLAPSIEELQTLIGIAEEFVRGWKMDFSIAKCKIMALRQYNPTPQPTLFLNGRGLQWCTSYKHLGLVLSHGEDMFKEAIIQRCAAALAEAKEVATLSASRVQTPIQDRALLYLSTIAPRRDYGLHAARLSKQQLEKLSFNEKTILTELRITRKVPKQRQFLMRYQAQSRKLRRKLERAPWSSWRKYLVQRLPRPQG